ncbi:transposase zinc-binding domain-containing protein [Arsenophonus nasoniae]|uniref:transposase zinc-binding domain-containing protein n=1 Tax=Arsenophonus nasoniae TaxID=638 RepID=UPI0023EADF38|nr:transposase zinc-binding domain-containing protein [Arsenophonus nasoniae]
MSGAIVALRLIVLTAVFFCQSCKSKACSSCGFKATEQWLAQQVHILPDCDWQHITFTMPHLLWPFLTITGRYLMLCFGSH